MKKAVKPGVKTLVSPKSEKDLPTDIDRVDQVSLPPGSAHPKSPQIPGGGGGGGREIPNYVHNTPDNGISERPRTMAVPGEDYGHPTKFDYGYVTRRTMTARVAWRHLAGERAFESSYQEDRERILAWVDSFGDPIRLYREFVIPEGQELRYQNLGVYWTPEKKRAVSPYGRNDHPSASRVVVEVLAQRKDVDEVGTVATNRRYSEREVRLLPGSTVKVVKPSGIARGKVAAGLTQMAARIADLYLGSDWNPPKSVPPRKRQRRQRGRDKLDDQKYYRRNKSKIKRDVKKRQKRVQNKPKQKRYDQWYAKEYYEKGNRGFRRRSGDLFLYDQENPKDNIDAPGDNLSYSPTSPSHYQRNLPGDRSPVPGSPGPDKHLDNANPASGRVVPNGEGQMWSGEETYVKSAALISEIQANTGPEVQSKASDVGIRLKRADPKRGFWTFEAQGTKGVYTIRLKGIRQGNVKDLSKAQVQVSCDCPFFRWQGPEHWAKQNDYLYGEPRGTASKPVVKDPSGKHWACKHVVSALQMASQYRFGSLMPGMGAVPDYAASSSRVASRWLDRR